MDVDPIVQQVFFSEALARRVLNRLNAVEGEIQDEDGDSANGFILADPIPTQLSAEALKRKHEDELGFSCKDPFFSCRMCGQQISLHLALPILSCTCLFCKPCLVLHASNVLKKQKIAENSDMLTASAGSSSILDSISCPSPFCTGEFALTELQTLAPDLFIRWEQAANEALFSDKACFVRCPGCRVIIEKVKCELPPGLAPSGVPEFDRTVPFTETDNEGKPLSRRAMYERAVNRFKCAVCSVEFCAECLLSPYHLGKTCVEVEDERRAIRCIYCKEIVVTAVAAAAESTKRAQSVKEVQRELEEVGVDFGWCVEKKELLEVQRLTSAVCGSKECRKKLREACSRTLDCGHRCGGVRGERHCLPCLEDECSTATCGSDLCTICMVDSLFAAPSIALLCGHIVHLHCAKDQIEKGYPGPYISFGYLKCSQCKKMMCHSALDVSMQSPLSLFETIKAKALKRMRMDKKDDENDGEMAAEKYRYYICSKCKAPYFGGKQECGVNLE